MNAYLVGAGAAFIATTLGSLAYSKTHGKRMRELGTRDDFSSTVGMSIMIAAT